MEAEDHDLVEGGLGWFCGEFVAIAGVGGIFGDFFVPVGQGWEVVVGGFEGAADLFDDDADLGAVVAAVVEGDAHLHDFAGFDFAVDDHGEVEDGAGQGDEWASAGGDERCEAETDVEGGDA